MDINPFDLLDHKMDDGILVGLSNPKNYDIQEDVEIPSVIDGKTLTQIERIAGLNHVVSLKIPESVRYISHRSIIRSVFFNCDSLQQLSIYDNLLRFSLCTPAKFIEQDEESGNTVFTKDRSKTIGNAIFNLLSHPLSTDCTIQNTAFYKCPKFRKIIISHAENSDGIIRPVLFKGVQELQEAVIGNGVNIIGDDAFAYCLNLEKIVIPPSVTGIRCNAFHYDTKLQIYGTPGSYAEKYAAWFGFPFHETEEADEIV